MENSHKNALIVCAMPTDISLVDIGFSHDTWLVIAADKGYIRCEELGITPDIVLGDFDSAPVPPSCLSPQIFPVLKDDTDSMLAIKEAINQGCSHITIIGATGGRLDHTYANIQCLAYIAKQGCTGKIVDSQNTIMLVQEGCPLVISKFDGYLSLFAYTPTVKGVTITGALYSVDNIELTTSFPLGISNKITAQHSKISCTSGMLLVITSTEHLI